MTKPHGTELPKSSAEIVPLYSQASRSSGHREQDPTWSGQRHQCTFLCHYILPASTGQKAATRLPNRPLPCSDKEWNVARTHTRENEVSGWAGRGAKQDRQNICLWTQHTDDWHRECLRVLGCRSIQQWKYAIVVPVQRQHQLHQWTSWGPSLSLRSGQGVRDVCDAVDDAGYDLFPWSNAVREPQRPVNIALSRRPASLYVFNEVEVGRHVNILMIDLTPRPLTRLTSTWRCTLSSCLCKFDQGCWHGSAISSQDDNSVWNITTLYQSGPGQRGACHRERRSAKLFSSSW